MSNPEKRDERSMSDILASIRKIMAQEPALAAPPNPTRPSLNGVSGGVPDMPREPELRLPPEKPQEKPQDKKPSEILAAPPPAAGAVEPVSLDELLAETPRAAPPPAAPMVKPAPALNGAAPALSQPSGEAPEWLFPKPSKQEPAKERPATPLPVPPQARDMNGSASSRPAADVQSAVPASESAPADERTAAKAPAAPPPVMGPPAPGLGDLGSVVPGKFDAAGPQATPALGPPAPSVNGERSVLGPPQAGPLLGEPTRAPAASGPLPEVPGADALRRLIAGVIPPSAHPSVAPSAKAPEPSPPARAGDAKLDVGLKHGAEAKAEMKPATAPVEPAPAAKKVEISAPAPTVAPPATKPAAVAPAVPAAAAPAPKPELEAAPGPVGKADVSPVSATAPATKTAVAAPVVSKTLDETVVELLRPLLREWLNANMPRLIEPALKAEIEALRDAVARDKKE